MKTSPNTIERGINEIRMHNADAAEALFYASETCGALANLHDPADQARTLNQMRVHLLDAQKAIAEAIYASGQIQISKLGKVAA